MRLKEWVSISELVGLNGLPKTPQAILRKAKREDWWARKRKGKKGMEYHVSNLSCDTVIALQYKWFKEEKEKMVETSEYESFIEEMNELNKMFLCDYKRKEYLENEEEKEIKARYKSMSIKIRAIFEIMLGLWLQIVSDPRCSKTDHYWDFVSRYNNPYSYYRLSEGYPCAVGWVKEIIPKISTKKIYSWTKYINLVGLYAELID